MKIICYCEEAYNIDADVTSMITCDKCGRQICVLIEKPKGEKDEN